MNYLLSPTTIKKVLMGIWFYLKSDDNIFAKILLGFWAYIGGIHSYIFLTLTLIIIDTLIGVYYSITKTEFILKKMIFGVWAKVVNYTILLGSTFLLEQILKSVWAYNFYYMVFFICFTIGLYELSSIFKGLFNINPHLTFIKRYIDLSNRFSSVLFDKAEKRIEKGVDDFMGLKDDNQTSYEENKEV